MILASKNKQLRTLDQHRTIGLDLDGTLILGPHSTEIQSWARATDQQIHIITFRRSVDDLGDFLLRFPSILAVHTLPDHITEFSRQYQHWKGQTCANIGATALIDDDIAGVEAGCKKYGIQLFDSKHWVS